MFLTLKKGSRSTLLKKSGLPRESVLCPKSLGGALHPYSLVHHKSFREEFERRHPAPKLKSKENLNGSFTAPLLGSAMLSGTWQYLCTATLAGLGHSHTPTSRPSSLYAGVNPSSPACALMGSTQKRRAGFAPRIHLEPELQRITKPEPKLQTA